jgi:hypothetical protein
MKLCVDLFGCKLKKILIRLVVACLPKIQLHDSAMYYCDGIQQSSNRFLLFVEEGTTKYLNVIETTKNQFTIIVLLFKF